MPQATTAACRGFVLINVVETAAEPTKGTFTMPSRTLLVLLSAALFAGCAVPDIYSLPDLARGMASGSKAAVDAPPVLVVADGESLPNTCDLQILFIYQPDVPAHRVKFSTRNLQGSKVLSTGAGELELPINSESLFFQQTADGPAYRGSSSSVAAACDQVIYEISIECQKGPCPKYQAGQRSDRGDRAAVTVQLSANF